MREFRCAGRQHATLDGNVLKVRCFSKIPCGAGGGTVVEHHFDIRSGRLIETRKFQDPSKLFKKEEKEECPSASIPSPSV